MFHIHRDILGKFAGDIIIMITKPFDGDAGTIGRMAFQGIQQFGERAR